MSKYGSMELPSGSKFIFEQQGGQLKQIYQVIDGARVPITKAEYDKEVDRDPKIPKK